MHQGSSLPTQAMFHGYEDLSCRTFCLIAGRRRRVGACELVCCRPLNVIKIITSKKSLVISFVVHSWFCQSELRFCQIKVNLLAGHLEMTGKQINLNLKNRKTNRLLAHTILRFYGSTFQNGQTVREREIEIKISHFFTTRFVGISLHDGLGITEMKVINPRGLTEMKS